MRKIKRFLQPFLAVWLLLESLLWLMVLSVRLKLREVKKKMKKQKTQGDQMPPLSPKKSLTMGLSQNPEKKSPPFPPQDRSQKNQSLKPEKITSGTIGEASRVESIGTDPVLIKAAGALLDLPFRAVHLALDDVQPLSDKEIEYMAEPMAEIAVDLGWEKWLRKGIWIKFGIGISSAVVTRYRAHAAFVKAHPKKTGPGMAQVRRTETGPVEMTAEKPVAKVDGPPLDVEKLRQEE